MISPGGPYALKIDGRGRVRRFFSNCSLEVPPAATSPPSDPKDTPAIRRNAPRNGSVIFIMIYAPPRIMWGQPPSAVRRAQLDNSCGSGTSARELYPFQQTRNNKKAP